MTEFDPNAFEDALIDHMRANDGNVTTGPLAGHPLLVLTSTGATTGEPRRAILTFSRDGEDYVVAGTASGAPTDPAWVRNLLHAPDVAVEAEGRQFEATARVVDGADRDRLWNQHVEALPWFAEYPEKSGRTIPMVRLTPVTPRKGTVGPMTFRRAASRTIEPRTR
jgi:deazaflavin-dependent oxidoreductase (nitroreductase family)